MLRADHQMVESLFERFEKLRGSERKAKLVDEICTALETHTRLEEEIFYPAVREAIEDADLMDEALVEHQSAKELIAQLRAMDPDDDLYEAKVTVLGEYIRHHVKEEQGEMFPQARSSGIDLKELGERMRERRAQIEKGGAIEAVRRIVR
jgi:hemerythrin superfamily protein